jgi:hypothetical protein
MVGPRPADGFVVHLRQEAARQALITKEFYKK